MFIVPILASPWRRVLVRIVSQASFASSRRYFPTNLDCWEEIFLDPTELNCQKEAGQEIHLLLIPWCRHLVCVEPKVGMYSSYPLNLW